MASGFSSWPRSGREAQGQAAPNNTGLADTSPGSVQSRSRSGTPDRYRRSIRRPAIVA